MSYQKYFVLSQSSPRRHAQFLCRSPDHCRRSAAYCDEGDFCTTHAESGRRGSRQSRESAPRGRLRCRSRGARNIGTLNTELHDVQRIMVQNIDDLE